MAEPVPLDELKPGDSGIVSSLEGEDVLVQRLYEIGMIEGSRITFLRRAPLGDPIEVQIDDRFNLSLRRSDAHLILVDVSN